MIKSKLAVLLAAAAWSLSAHAGFIQYNVGGGFADGGSLGGYFVQNTDTQAIVYLDLHVAGGDLFGAQFFGSGTMSNISSASTYYSAAGPTNFSAFNDQDVTFHTIDLTFGHGTLPGTYRVAGINAESGLFSNPPYSRVVVSGSVTEGVIDPNLLASLENGDTYVNQIVPTLIADPAPVPEPASLALLMLGLGGWALARRNGNTGQARGVQQRLPLPGGRRHDFLDRIDDGKRGFSLHLVT